MLVQTLRMLFLSWLMIIKKGILQFRVFSFTTLSVTIAILEMISSSANQKISIIHPSKMFLDLYKSVWLFYVSFSLFSFHKYQLQNIIDLQKKKKKKGMLRFYFFVVFILRTSTWPLCSQSFSSS